MKGTKIGLALSGGGSRSIAFHLGCLRALDELELLNDVKVISTVSGGSIIGGLLALHDGPFSEFEKKIHQILAKGLLFSMVYQSFTTKTGILTLFSFVIMILYNLLLVLSSILLLLPLLLCKLINQVFPAKKLGFSLPSFKLIPSPKFSGLTPLLQLVLEDVFEEKLLSEIPSDKPIHIFQATELRTSSAFYFSNHQTGMWRYNQTIDGNISLAFAVTASAAYPLYLNPLEESFTFRKKDGSCQNEPITLTDGGIYDNLGLSPLWPGRDPKISLNVTEIDNIICCYAGHGLSLKLPNQSYFGNIKNSFGCVHDRVQRSSMNRLFNLKDEERLEGFLLPYLGQDDSKLKYPPDNLVKRNEVNKYPTDFCAMKEEWIEKISNRGYQLTMALVREHHPEILNEIA